MEELIFFGIIIALSIIDSVARTVKARRAAKRDPSATGPQATREARRSARAAGGRGWQEAGAPSGSTRAPARSTGASVPTYDADATYDERATYDAKPTYDARTSAEWSSGEVVTYDDTASADETASYDDAATRDERAGAGDAGASSAAGMIPQDLWEEIAGLARGRVEQAPAGRPRPLPVPTSAHPAPAPARSTKPARVSETHPIHLTHADFGTDPSERVMLERFGGGRVGSANADVRAVRGQLAGGVSALRQAVILQEVLGPPASLREDRVDELLEL